MKVNCVILLASGLILAGSLPTQTNANLSEYQS